MYGDPYIDGDKVPALTPDNPTYYPWAAREISRPTIKARAVWSDTTHIVNVHRFYIASGGKLLFEAVILDAVPDNGGQHPDWPVYARAMVYGDPTSAVAYWGCIFVTRDPTDNGKKWTIMEGAAEGNLPSASYCRCVFLQGGLFCDMAGVSAQFMMLDNWPGGHETLYQAGNLLSATKDGKLTGIIRGPNGEPRNLMINFVV